MIKIVSLFALMGMAAAAPGAISYGGPAYAAAPAYAQAPLGYAAPVAAYAPAVAKYAAPLAYAQPIAKAVVASPEPYDAHPQYNYGYSVSDAITGDSKTATESRDGDVVQGQYSLVEPDGAIRTVTYTADPIHGFNAVVDRQAPAVVKKVVAAPVAVKAFGAPAYAGYAHGPVGYAAGPVGYAAHGPVAHY